ncbi:MAG: DegT/DnrJ/EryC1/StrS family aminotransferase [Candidatus Pacebacteria bacterium]|nr:DegT/DnrJ/EryC1/StrS family aminotransferase [Candidatus Paceibacterota bacterium]
MSQSSSLALHGGSPVVNEPLRWAPWPPVSEATADKLRDVYLSREWSFNSPMEQQFQRTFADYHDAEYGIFMANGTVTLQCALAACGVGAGDEVIVPALTWMATAMAVHYVGATPVFVDIEPTTLCLDPTETEAAITPRTRAVIPVHLYGGMANLDALGEICKKRDLIMIEDCAHMQGGKWRGKGAGSWGAVGSFSFQQSKTVASGEGGMCITSDATLADKIYRIKHIGYNMLAEQGGAKDGPPAGLMCHNFRATAFQAVILDDQTQQLAERIRKYEESAKIIADGLADVPGVRIQQRGAEATEQGYYAFCFIFDSEPLADIPLSTILEACRAEGLNLGMTYGTVYNHVLYNMPAESYRIANANCPVAEHTAAQRTAMFLHYALGADRKTIDTIPKILAKVAENAQALR